ncbi:hypothetical protein ES703_21922 [subsurface metagenome]
MRKHFVFIIPLLLCLTCAQPIDVEPGTPELLYEGFVGLSPELSPDGKYLALPEQRWVGDSEAVDILLLDVESGEVMNLTQYNPSDGIPQAAMRPCWAPDSQTVYFIQVIIEYDEPIYSICRIPSIGGDIVPLLTLFEAHLLAVNGAGSELAFVYKDEDHVTHIERYRLANGMLTPAPGGDGVDVTSLRYTPDGDALMATIGRDPDIPYRSDVVLFPLDGGEPVEFDCRFDWPPTRVSFSPDGQQCLFQCFQYHCVVPITGGEGTYLLPDVWGEITRGAWFSDGYIYFVLDWNEIWRYEPQL